MITTNEPTSNMDRLRKLRALAAAFNEDLTRGMKERRNGWFRLNVRLENGVPREVRVTLESSEDLRTLD